MGPPASARRLHGVVLAAGSGLRMGGPKALLRVGGRTLLERHLARLRDAGCADLVAVVRPPTPSRRHAPSRTASVRGPARRGGHASERPRSSRRSGVCGSRPTTRSSSPPSISLPPRVETLLALAAALDARRARRPEAPLAVTPSHRGRGGAPGLVGARPRALPPRRDAAAARSAGHARAPEARLGSRTVDRRRLRRAADLPRHAGGAGLNHLSVRSSIKNSAREASAAWGGPRRTAPFRGAGRRVPLRDDEELHGPSVTPNHARPIWGSSTGVRLRRLARRTPSGRPRPARSGSRARS
ncbi:MAG: NTP transferase domain-containing protein [Labilithrix sp.]|nr:NTP transferase domain-containing protein [Labilithrix sp.]